MKRRRKRELHSDSEEWIDRRRKKTIRRRSPVTARTILRRTRRKREASRDPFLPSCSQGCLSVNLVLMERKEASYRTSILYSSIPDLQYTFMATEDYVSLSLFSEPFFS